MMKNVEPYNIAIYARESRDDNFENYETIENQIGLLKEFAKKSKLGRVIRVYEDDNVSGTLFDRDGLKKLEADILDKKINAIILKDLSRLGRNNAKTLLFLDFLEEQKVRVITADSRYDSLKDNETVGIETWANERYCRDLSRKIRATLRYKIEKGEYIGKAPYGYKKSAAEKNKLVIEQRQAEVVKKIFELYCEGYGYFSIAQIFNSKKIAPPSKGKKTDAGWNAVAVGRILSNKAYIGATVQGVSEKINFKSKKTRKLPEEEWIITLHTHQPIIDDELFDKVMKIKNAKVIFSGAHKDNIHILRGFLFCGKCGTSMYARMRKGIVGYICGNYFKNGKVACDSHYVREEYICKCIENHIIKMLEDENVFNECRDELQLMFMDNLSDSNKVQYLGIELNKTKAKQETLYMDRLDGLISLELYKKINLDLDEQISDIKNKINIINNKESHDDIESIIKDFSERLRLTGISRNCCALCIEKIIVGSDNESDSNEIVIKMCDGF